MRRLIATRPNISSTLAILLPVGLWVILWLSISPGNPAAILNPGNPLAFAQGLRAVFPLIVAGAAAIIIGVKLVQRIPSGFGFFSPLALATVYGLVGLTASLKSPDASVALWWSALYLSVPIVLWGVTWGATPLDRLRRLVDATWLAMILASAALFVVAAIYLGLVNQALNPPQLLNCETEQWLDITSGRLRGTGVGRYAAIAGLIAISGLWQGKWWSIWLMVLITSLTLLLFTVARGSFVGFAAGASLILLIYLINAGKRAWLAALLTMLLLVPLVGGTGIHRDFLENCLLRGSPAPSVFVAIETIASSFNASKQVTDRSSDGDDSEKEKPAQAAVVTPPTSTVAAPANSADVASSPDPTAPAPEAVVAPVTSTVAAPVSSADVASSPDPTAPAPEAVVAPKAESSAPEPGPTRRFLKFSGRTAVWAEGWGLIKSSPLIGYGFHADRLLLGTHMHNSVMQALLQAGLIGAMLFVAAVIFAWVLFFKIVRKLTLLSRAHKHLVIQCGGVLAFLTMRSFPESTGAFFGVDWLILALVLFYLQVVNYGRPPLEVDSDRPIFERE